MKKTDMPSALRHMILALCVGVIITCVFSAYATNTEKSISDSVIRLHVIANSDSEEDQQLKLAVRDGIIEESGSHFAKERNISSAREEILLNLESIRETAERIIREKGYGYDVSVELGKSEFPTKAYGGVTLPAGTYEALKVIIGEGDGKNWWCVLFPPLCFVDAATAQIPDESKDILKNTLTADEYAMITDSGEFSVEVRFKVYEMWQSSKLKLKNMMALNK